MATDSVSGDQTHSEGEPEVGEAVEEKVIFVVKRLASRHWEIMRLTLRGDELTEQWVIAKFWEKAPALAYARALNREEEDLGSGPESH